MCSEFHQGSVYPSAAEVASQLYKAMMKLLEDAKPVYNKIASLEWILWSAVQKKLVQKKLIHN